MKWVQLLKLEAYGFKSFADKLEIEFDKGITAIVGPNGSGKSNITDAIRWVLGEQNVRSLRGTKTEDIIFTGSATRRALGIAEVSLTFDNSDGKLPLDFQEVVITRRLFRSGESEYYINKARCRLKDVYELFADTGLGKDAISVISQNKIDQVLNSRPEERRLLFEETAGITKYRNRKRESLKKMDDTAQNILRVTDILTELEHQLGPLAEHAEKTRKYNALREVYQQCKLTLLVNRYEEQKRSLEECERQKQEISQANQASGVKIQLLEVDKEQLNHELLEVEKSLQLLAAKNSELGEKIEKNHSDLAIFQERLRQNGETEERCQTLLQTLRQNLAGDEEKALAIRRALAVARQEAEAMRERVRESAARESALQQAIRENEAAAVRLRQKSFAQAQALLQKKNDIALQERDLKELTAQQLEMEKETAELIRQQGERQNTAARLKEKLTNLVKAGQAAAAARETAAVKAGQAEEAKRQNELEVQAMVQELNAAKTRLRFLRGMQEEYEGFGRAAKRVLKNDFPWHKGICGAVAEVVRIGSAHITALEIALGGALQHIITESDAAAKQAITFLKREKLGRVTFLPLNTIVPPARRQPNPTVTAAPGFVGYANDLVECDAKYRKIVDFLLAKTIVVDHIDTALQLARQLGFRARIVTLEGEMLNPGGSMTGGSNARREVSFLNRAGEIEELAAHITKFETAMGVAVTVNKELEEELRCLQLAVDEQAGLAQRLQIEQAQTKAYAEQAAADCAADEIRRQKLREKAAGQGERAAEIRQATARVAEEIQALENTENLQRRDDEHAATNSLELAAKKEAAGAELVERKIAQTVAEQEMIRARENEQALQAALHKGHEELERLGQEKRTLQAAARELALNSQEVSGTNERLKELKAIGVKDYDNFHQVKLEKLVKIQEIDQEIKNLRKVYNDLQNKIHQMDLAYTKYTFEVNTCLESLRDDFQLSAEEALAARLIEGTAVLHRRVDSLQLELDALGSINPNAIGEYEAMSKRYGFMKKQADDLIAAKNSLMAIIKEIDASMAKQFTAAFTEISRYFSEIAERLFGGGQAKLELSDDKNVLETGIEISVQPPNKKLQSLSVLSGGERALTVIALLFSFLRFRPAPFSVVDEIDAPLDEANVDRFSDFLREYAEHTQFIVVTHRKGTMQAADVMHGVTVEDSGVSKIISVKLADQAAEKWRDE